MTKDYSLAGTHVINRYLWQNLKTSLPDDFAKYLVASTPTTPNPAYNLVPIVPSQQSTTFTNIAGGAPFMIYNYSIEGGDEIWDSREQIGYVIYDDNEARLRRIQNFMVTLLRRMDWTAQDINAYTASNPDLNEFDFKWVKVDNAASPQPFTSEGGRHGAMIMCTAMYTRDMTDRGMRA